MLNQVKKEKTKRTLGRGMINHFGNKFQKIKGQETSTGDLKS